MKCPYCGAEANGRKCEFCNSDLSEFIKKSYVADDFEDDEDGDEYLSDEELEDILKLCMRFQKKYPEEFSVYDEDGKLIAGNGVKDKLFKVLDIPDDEQIFLIHDDTLFKNGGNGFAITDSAFYCLELGEELEITEYDDIDEDDEVDYENSVVYLTEDETSLAYFSGNDRVLEDLSDLYDDIFEILLG